MARCAALGHRGCTLKQVNSGFVYVRPTPWCVAVSLDLPGSPLLSLGLPGSPLVSLDLPGSPLISRLRGVERSILDDEL